MLLELAAGAPDLVTREYLLARVWAGTDRRRQCARPGHRPPAPSAVGRRAKSGLHRDPTEARLSLDRARSPRGRRRAGNGRGNGAEEAAHPDRPPLPSYPWRRSAPTPPWPTTHGSLRKTSRTTSPRSDRLESSRTNRRAMARRLRVRRAGNRPAHGRAGSGCPFSSCGPRAGTSCGPRPSMSRSRARAPVSSRARPSWPRRSKRSCAAPTGPTRYRLKEQARQEFFHGLREVDSLLTAVGGDWFMRRRLPRARRRSRPDAPGGARATRVRLRSASGAEDAGRAGDPPCPPGCWLSSSESTRMPR